MSTQERIKQDARVKYQWASNVRQRNAFELAFKAGALSERNKVIEEVLYRLSEFEIVKGNPIYNALESLKV